ncbi:MAG: D-sedoheptulose-7-phosphate isomerase [Chthoniobacteraceae bacterium]
MQSWIQNYLDAQRRTVEALPVDQIAAAIETIREAWRHDRQIFAIGNGGSAANCSHFSTDLGKCSSDATGHPFRVLSLTDNTAWITALGNDYAYEDVFVRQLRSYGQLGDVLIGVSVSGNSPNCVKAFEWAKERGMRTIALVGGKRGRLAEIAEQVIVVDDTHYGRVEDAQMHLLHMFCYAFVELKELQQR